MTISKTYGNKLDKVPNGGVGAKMNSGAVGASDFSPGAKGIGSLYVSESGGGGPFHLVVKQGSKTITDNPRFIGGNILSYAIGEKVGARLRPEDGDITFTCAGAKHDPVIVPNYDAG